MRAVRRLGDDAIELLHLRRATDDGSEALLALHLLAQDAILAGKLQVPQNPVQDQPQLFEIEGLGDVVVGALLHRLHRRLDAGIAGHHDHHRLRTAPLDLFQNLQPAQSRQPEIEQHHVDAGRIQHPEGVLGIVRYVGGITDALGNIPATLPDRALIIHNEQIQQVGLRLVLYRFHS